MSKLERITVLDPAYDKRSKDPSRNYGIQGVTLRMVLKGKEGAVQFLLYTNWMLPNVEDEIEERIRQAMIHSPAKKVQQVIDKLDGLEIGEDIHLYSITRPLPADLGYHSPVPRYRGQSPIQQSCEYTGDKPCYYDGSGTNAKEVFDVLVKKGSEAVWEELEKYYKATFLEEAA